MESPHRTRRVYLGGEGAGTKPTARRARLDLTFQTRAVVCQRDMGRGEGPLRMFHSPSARHSQTFPPCVRGIRLTRPGCGARGAGLGALPRSRSRSRSRRGSRAGLGFLRYKLGARRGAGGGEDRRESGPGLGAPAPLRVPAGQRRRRRPGPGIGSPGRRRLRAASLPAALPARWRQQRRRPRQTMNLRARRAEPRQVWARRPSAGFPRGYRGAQRGASPRRRSRPRSWRPVLWGHAGKGCPRRRPSLHAPSLARENAAGDRGLRT